MQAILADWQIARLAEVFQVDRLEILATRVELPPQLSWEVVATQTPQGAFFPDTEFLENIQDYKYNRLINIGGDSKYRTTHSNSFQVFGQTIYSFTRRYWGR